MAVADPLNNLPEDNLRLLLIKPPMLLDIRQQIPVGGIFHHNEEVLAVLEDLEQADDIHVDQGLEDEDLLEDFHAGVVVLHVDLINALYGYIVVREYLLSKMDLAEGALAQEFYKLVEVESCRWWFTLLLVGALDRFDHFLLLQGSLTLVRLHPAIASTAAQLLLYFLLTKALYPAEPILNALLDLAQLSLGGALP